MPAELMTCAHCQTTTLIQERRVEDDCFVCNECKVWRNCWPESPDAQRRREEAEAAQR